MATARCVLPRPGFPARIKQPPRSQTPTRVPTPEARVRQSTSIVLWSTPSGRSQACSHERGSTSRSRRMPLGLYPPSQGSSCRVRLETGRSRKTDQQFSVTSFLCVIPYPPYPPSLFHRRQLDAEDLAIDVVELHGQRPRAMIDPTAAEELKRLAWRPVRLQARRNAQQFHLGTKGPIHLVRAEGAGVQRPRHELPEWIELGEARARRTVVMGRTVVDVRRQPHHVADV